MIIVIGIISVLCFAAALALLFLYLPAKKELQFAADKNKELFDALGKANVQNASLEADLRNKTDLNLKYTEEIKEKESSFEALNKELTSTKEEAARLRADVANAENFKSEQEKNFNALQNAAKEQFKNMADSLLKQKTEELKGTNKELLNPFSERLDKLQDKLARMQDLNENLAQEASSLTKALTYNKIQGNFGEVTLERILQNCGLKEGENYRKQVHLKDDGGKDKIPDFIIDLPDGRYIVVDSKMSLTAYNNFVNEQDEEKKNAFLKEHIKSVEDHIKELSAQNYQDLKDVRGKSPDFVIMYVPLEYAYLTALEAKKDLGIFASNSKVAVATASSIIPILKTIENLWKIMITRKNMEEIIKTGQNIHSQAVNFLTEMGKIENGLASAQNAYTEAYKKLNGRQGIVGYAKKLEELGIKSNKELKYEEEHDAVSI